MSLPLHPKKGLNPHMLKCMRCGADIGVVLLGKHDYKVTCKDCGTVHYGGTGSRPAKCQKCGSYNLGLAEPISDYEPVYGDICEECQKEIAAFTEEVKAGGVFFVCDNCGAEGVIKRDTELAKLTREELGLSEPTSGEYKPAGIRLERCPRCMDKPEKEEKNDGQDTGTIETS